MKIREMFRAAKHLTLTEADAGKTPLRDLADKEMGKGELNKGELKQQARDQTSQFTTELAGLQEMLYAQRKYKLLLVLQGMDTSGKDGTVSSLFSHINPMGLRAVGFKTPSPVELAHDFLWRVHPHTPMAGEIAIFNRSHYEDVLITVVQGLIDDKQCKRRYAQINDFERLLAENDTVIVKVFLHISKDEQRARLQARIDDPNKQWKFDASDVTQRKHWDAYQRAYERAICATNADHAPWYVVPANSKPQRDLAIAALLLETMQALDLHYPPPNPALTGLKVD